MPLLAQTQKRMYRLKTIEQALKDKNPDMYLQRKRSKKLPLFLSHEEEAMMESYYEAYSQAKDQILSAERGPKDHLEAVRQLNTARRKPGTTPVQTWLEFPTTS